MTIAKRYIGLDSKQLARTVLTAPPADTGEALELLDATEKQRDLIDKDNVARRLAAIHMMVHVAVNAASTDRDFETYANQLQNEQESLRRLQAIQSNKARLEKKLGG